MAQRGASLQLNSAKNSSLPASSVVEWHQAEEEPAWQKLSPNSQRPPFLSPLTSTLTYPWFVTSRRYIEKCIFRNNFFCMTYIYLEAGKWKLGRKQKRRKSAKWELLLVLESKEAAFSSVAGWSWSKRKIATHNIFKKNHILPDQEETVTKFSIFLFFT